MDGAFGKAELRRKHIQVGKGSSEFQVAVGDGPPGVGCADEVAGYVRKEMLPPDNGEEGAGVGGRDEVHPAHARDGSVACPHGVGVRRWKELGDACRPVDEVLCQPAPVIQEVMDMAMEADAVALLVAKCLL